MTSRKAPAFQYYPKDHIMDAQLCQASLTTRGLRWEIVSMMWSAPERGRYTVSPKQIPRIFNCTETERDLFLSEARQYGFCDIDENRDGTLTITCRRMHREHKSAAGHRIRQERYRSKRSAAVRDASGDADSAGDTSGGDGDGGDAEVTPPSSLSASASSSASSSEGKKESFQSSFPSPQKEASRAGKKESFPGSLTHLPHETSSLSGRESFSSSLSQPPKEASLDGPKESLPGSSHPPKEDSPKSRRESLRDALARRGVVLDSPERREETPTQHEPDDYVSSVYAGDTRRPDDTRERP